MKERPILFSGPMVRAILDGKKTQTRRVANVPAAGQNGGGLREVVPSLLHHRGDLFDARYELDNPRAIRCPYGAPGDRLWVRETWRVVSAAEGELGYRATESARRFLGEEDRGDRVWWRTWEKKSWGKHDPVWVPAIYMPRWASRITLEVTAVRVERLQSISERDAEAEGITPETLRGAKYKIRELDGTEREGEFAWTSCAYAFGLLWDGINGKRAPWASDPWVWIVEFKRVENDG